MTISMSSLLTTIENTRLEMIDLAHQYGYCSPYVVQCSQKLDTLLNDYHNTKIKH
ncbi:aspartyl-phosphate phosphatase Spo0E family protein [Neobacillus pocheonensis]|uniref:Aspartyl-phosphate phosphatase Spo0E family protein n=1 Tax=Neobacillus pocheonensis TaxID=363869 RepID=A0ABT0W6Z4_9BACI|nr:aspartyl-phosphate phosphatase Spo0E family protein [Neobacillus pocheonensis]